MPTGYTAGIADGTYKTFKEYAMACMRAFGALVMMRDDPSDTPIPTEIKPDPYFLEGLQEAEEELYDFNNMNIDDKYKMYQKEQKEKQENNKSYYEEKAETKRRYEQFLKECKLHTPPTPEHQRWHEFMIEQIKDSIEWDCGRMEDYRETPHVDFNDWVLDTEKYLSNRLVQKKQSYKEEVELCKKRTEWIQQALASLD